MALLAASQARSLGLGTYGSHVDVAHYGTHVAVPAMTTHTIVSSYPVGHYVAPVAVPVATYVNAPVYGTTYGVPVTHVAPVVHSYGTVY